MLDRRYHPYTKGGSNPCRTGLLTSPAPKLVFARTFESPPIIFRESLARKRFATIFKLFYTVHVSFESASQQSSSFFTRSGSASQQSSSFFTRSISLLNSSSSTIEILSPPFLIRSRSIKGLTNVVDVFTRAKDK